MTKATSPRPSSRRLGAQPRIETATVRKLYEESGLSRADFGALARASVRKLPNGGYSSSTVDYWLSEKRPRHMAADTYDLLVTRLWLLKERHASFSELVNQPLKDILAKLIE